LASRARPSPPGAAARTTSRVTAAEIRDLMPPPGKTPTIAMRIETDVGGSGFVTVSS